MGFLSGLLSRFGRDAAGALVEGVVQRALERASNLKQYRQLLAEGFATAAQSGDLDDAYNTYRSANRRADDFKRDG